MSSRHLEVTINEHAVGHLREQNDLWEFEYTADWIGSPQGFDLSPALARADRRHIDGASDRPVQWYFDNLLPEEEMRAVLAKEANIAQEDAFGLLAYLGSESAGSLVLRDPDHPSSTERGLKPLPLAELSRRIGNLPHISLTRDAPKHMSAAGAQPKLLIVLRGTELFEPLPGTASTHLLKPNHLNDAYPASVMNECFTMRLAAAVRLPVPKVTRLYVPQPVYIVERFDREPAPASGAVASPVDAWPDIRRRHIIDTCQLLNKSRAFKYTGAKLDSITRAIEFCRSKAAARLQLYQWLVFNVLIGNGDNHLKNLSFLVDPAGINLAPAYDLLSTAVYDTRTFANERAHWPQSILPFSVGTAPTFADVTREQLLVAGQALGLASATAQRELNRLVKAIPEEAAKLIESIQSRLAHDIRSSPDPTATRRYVAAETRVLDTIKHLVINDMVRRLS
jgi:serine/threonine-protein kinase HipA